MAILVWIKVAYLQLDQLHSHEYPHVNVSAL